MIGFGLHLSLRQAPSLTQRQQQLCTVCRQSIETYLSERDRANVLILGGPYALCLCCHQAAPDPGDRNYRRRFRRWRARHG